jgi:pullulanase
MYMSYHRGGKVWIDASGCGWVALDKDWTGDSLPDDLISENGLIGTDLKLADYKLRAAIAGYAISQGQWFFFLSDQAINFHQFDGNEIFLVGDFNNWELSSQYQLTEVEDGWGLYLSLERLDGFRECEFKFLTTNGMWVDPHSHFPNAPRHNENGRNFWFHQDRSGKDLFYFRVIETVGGENLDKWISRRPAGDFGFSFNGKYSEFRIFAPRAHAVDLLVKAHADSLDYDKFEMIRADDGSWSVEGLDDLTGKHYMYNITQFDRHGELFSKEILDPYALASFSRNGPGIALERKTFLKNKPFIPPAIEDAVVVEAHLRDLLALAPIDISKAERFEFIGLKKWLCDDNCYLRKLGANVVELQPVQEFDAKQKDEYHWGYMPVNFFSPASVYASKANDGRVVQEFAQLVDAFHEAGLAVVVDVVYNHIGIPPHLIHLDKEIYCSIDEQGRLSNCSGCGNDLRSDSEPAKKLILDSLLYWVEVFDVDGFRFDLGELLGFELLKEIETELRKVKSGILLFAEPWSFRGRLPIEMNQTNYALWSDECREQLLRFAKQQIGNEPILELLRNGLDHTNLHPCQSVNYLESHDDYALVDRFRDLPIWEGEQIPDEVVWRIMFAVGLMLVSPGVPMLSAGQDFLRHKQGIRNTYLMGDVNALDYSLEEGFDLEVTFIRELINLRLKAPGRRARESVSDEWEVYSFDSESSGVIVFGWESKRTKEKFLISANNQTLQYVVDLPEKWVENAKMLTGYRSNKSSPRIVAPLSFSWFAYDE